MNPHEPYSVVGPPKPGESYDAWVLRAANVEVGKRPPLIPVACTPRCSSLHALDCPNYDGPLSRTGSLESAPHWSDTTGQTW